MNGETANIGKTLHWLGVGGPVVAVATLEFVGEQGVNPLPSIGPILIANWALCILGTLLGGGSIVRKIGLALLALVFICLEFFAIGVFSIMRGGLSGTQ